MTTIPTTRPRKMTSTEITKATLRIRRRLEDYLIDMPRYGNQAELRFIQAMIEVLYCIRAGDSGAEAIVNSVRNLTLRPRLREAFRRSTISSEHRPCVPSPSDLFY